MKYIEFAVSILFCVIAILWFKSSIDDGFPHEPALAVLGWLITLIDSLRRFGVFSKVYLSTRNSAIHPWSFSGGRVDKTDIRVELIIENNKDSDLIIRSIEIQSPVSVICAVGQQKSRTRLVDMEKIENDAFLPINIPEKSTKTILIESTHDASSIEKYIQATKIGRLKQVEPFSLSVTYTIGSRQKIDSVDFSIDTSQLLAAVRSKYEESGDHEGIVKLIEQEKQPASNYR